MTDILRPDAVIVGGGPAGLTAARSLRAAGVSDVLVLERESEAGGIPRHSDHSGYGIRDLGRILKGPAYARRLAERARESGAEILTSATVTGWAGDHSLLVTTPNGRVQVDARAVILATGARERPRAARMVPGDRPTGVYTTGQLQQAVYLQHEPVGRRAVIVGSELVSWSAVLTLRHADCRVALMTTEFESPEVFWPVAFAGRALLDGPLARATRVVRILGRSRVEAVTWRRVFGARSPATPLSSPVTGCPTTSSLGSPAWIWTGGTEARSSIRGWPPRSMVSLLRATFSTPSTPRMSRRSTASMSPSRSRDGSRVSGAPDLRSGLLPNSPSAGFPRASLARIGRGRLGIDSCCGRPKPGRSRPS